jgi:hypothetical protein
LGRRSRLLTPDGRDLQQEKGALALNTWLELDIACERVLLLGLFFNFITFRAGHAVIFLFGETHCETVLSWTYELGYGNNCTTAGEIFDQGPIL